MCRPPPLPKDGEATPANEKVAAIATRMNKNVDSAPEGQSRFDVEEAQSLLSPVLLSLIQQKRDYEMPEEAIAEVSDMNRGALQTMRIGVLRDVAGRARASLRTWAGCCSTTELAFVLSHRARGCRWRFAEEKGSFPPRGNESARR